MSSTSPATTTAVDSTTTASRHIQRRVHQILHHHHFTTTTTSGSTHHYDNDSSSSSRGTSLHTMCDYVASFYGDHNTLQDRRRLRGALERRAVQESQDMLGRLTPLYEGVKRLEEVAESMAASCVAMERNLRVQMERMRPFLQQIKHLGDQIEEKKGKLAATEEFLREFQLTDEEKGRLIGGSGSGSRIGVSAVDGAFFAALKRAHDIHAQCKSMLISEQHKAGLEIMEEMSTYLNRAYQTLSQWVQDRCKVLARDGFDDGRVEEELQKAMAALEERPVLLDCCVREIVAARKSFVVQSFFSALTGSSGSGTASLPMQLAGVLPPASKPIEMHAPDPLRYVGDMLAWIHRSAASERELIDSLLGIDSLPQSKTEALSSLSSSSVVPAHMHKKVQLSLNMLNEIFDALSGHLKARVEQVFSTNSDTVVSFRLAHLLELYSLSIGKMLGKSSALPLYLVELKEQSMERFSSELQSDSEDILTTNEFNVTDDLAPPDKLTVILEKLGEIMNTYSKSVVPEERREEDFRHVLSAILDPLSKRLEQGLDEQLHKGGNESIASAYIFAINCYFSLQSSLERYSFTASRVEELDAELDKCVERLIRHLSSVLLQRCGLSDILSIIQSNSTSLDKRPLSTVEGAEEKAISEQIQDFYGSLFSLGTEMLAPEHAHCDKIRDARLRHIVKNRVTAELSHAYRTLYKSVMDPANTYDKADEICYHSPEQIATLLGE